MTPKELANFLSAQHTNAKFLDRLKISYRPYICPFDQLLEQVSPEDTVLDIGCGSGQFAMLLAEFAKPKKIFGIEIIAELIKNANTLLGKYPNSSFRFEVFDGKNLPNDISDVTKVFMIDVLHHVPKQQQVDFLKHLYDKMSEGAKFILKDIDAGSPLVYCNKMHDMIFAGEIGNEWSFKNAKQILSEIGFKIKSTDKKTLYVYPHYTIVAEK